MRLMRKQFVLLALFLLGFIATSEAKLIKYTYPYEISELEWQLLNWTATWRGTTTLADPFILERMEYDRKARKVNVYVIGRKEQATEENLKKTIDSITSRFRERFPDFEPESDLIVHYNLKSEKGQQSFYMEYNNGAFVNQ